jgi:DNA-binding MarR family transcriptional regulator
MERDLERRLEILTAIEEGHALTQRDLAKRLNVALGLTNLHIKRLAKKGYIKIVAFPRKPSARKRLRYLLTPEGIAEKTRLAYAHITYSLQLYRRARELLRHELSLLNGNGLKRLALYGTGEAAELAYLTLRELGLEPLGVFSSREPADDRFLGFTVRNIVELATDEVDGVIVATFEPPEPYLAELRRLGFALGQLLTLRRPTQSGDDGAAMSRP